MLNEFILPGLYELYDLNIAFLQYYINNKDKINEDYEIFGVYGNFPYCIWNGEQAIFSDLTVLNDTIEHMFLTYANFHTRIFLNCTNTEITENMLEDTYSNLILNNLQRITASNQIVINSNLLDEYISQLYPVLCIDIGKYNNIQPDSMVNLKDEGFLFLNPKINNNFSLLKQYKNKKQLIMTLNPSLCINNCNILNECILKENLSQIMFDPRQSKNVFCKNINNNTNLQNIRESKLYISYKDISSYNNLNINHFILEHYGNIEDTLSEYITFFVQPKYWAEAFEILQQEI